TALSLCSPPVLVIDAAPNLLCRALHPIAGEPIERALADAILLVARLGSDRDVLGASGGRRLNRQPCHVSCEAAGEKRPSGYPYPGWHSSQARASWCGTRHANGCLSRHNSTISHLGV